MATQTQILAQSNGCVATLNWNNSTNTATSVSVNNTQGNAAATFQIQTSTLQSATVQPGATATITFPTALSLTIGTSTAGTQTLKGLTFFSMAA